MSFLKRAMLAVVRRKGKFVILFIIFLAIANMVLAGISIQQATSQASILAREKLGGQLTLRYNVQQAMQNMRNRGGMGMNRGGLAGQPVTQEMVMTVAEHPNIIAYNNIVSTNGIAVGFEPFILSDEEAEETQGNPGINPPVDGRGNIGIGGMGGTGFSIPDFTITGVTNSSLLEDFNNGNAILLEGSHITSGNGSQNEALIEINLAEQNALVVGDTIEIQSTAGEDSLIFMIVGIYQSNNADISATVGRGMMNFPFTQPFNRIYVNDQSAIDMKLLENSTQTTVGIDSAVFYVDDPKNIDRIKADATNMNIDWDVFILDANDIAYQQMMGPIENVASFSMTVIWVVAIAGAVILALILMLFIKERIYETGVLLSLGESKGKIISQYVTEVLIIAVLAFGLSIFSGSYIAQSVSNVLLERELQVVEEQASSGFNIPGMQGRQFDQVIQRFQRGGNNTVETIDSLDIRITASEIGQMASMGLLIILLGTILPSVTIMRFKPKDILIKAI